MADRITFLVLSVFMVNKVFGDVDCERSFLKNCNIPRMLMRVPPDVPTFNKYCPEIFQHLKCSKDYGDTCNDQGLIVKQKPDLYEATYATFSEICEEGTQLNIVAMENLVCFSDTLSRTRCTRKAIEFVTPYRTEQRNNPDSDDMTDYECLTEIFTLGCMTAALSENCEQKVVEATLDFIRRLRRLENYCSVEGAKSILEQMDTFDFKEDHKNSAAALLKEYIERQRE